MRLCEKRKKKGGSRRLTPCVAPQPRIDLDMLLRRALSAAHFDRNATTPVTDLVH
jgi:hypothetical protein